MNFELTEEQIAVRDAAREFAQTKLLPGVIERDENQNIINPRNLIEILSENQSSLIPSIGFVFDF